MPTQRRVAAGAAAPDTTGGTRILKKYPNRRLYDTRTSSYVTLVDVKRMVLSGEDFEVRDAKSGEDLTRSILLQIILEEESGGVPMFSTPMLAQIIRFYGHAMQGFMGQMLEKNLQTFVDLQQRVLGQGADPKPMSPEAWAPFLNPQAPLMQAWMESYTEQMQQLAQKLQSTSAFPGFPPTKR